MHWWDWVILVITALSLVGLGYQIWDVWWRRPPHGINIRVTIEKAIPTVTAEAWHLHFAPMGAEVLYELTLHTTGCFIRDGNRVIQHWSADNHAITSAQSVDYELVPQASRQPGSAMVEARWVSGTNRRTSLDGARYWIETDKLEKWKKYRVPQAHAEPGRWVEKTVPHETSG